MKIENKPVKYTPSMFRTRSGYRQFIETLGTLKPNQSIVLNNLPAHYRQAMIVVGYVTHKQFVAVKEPKGVRIGIITYDE